MALKKNWFYKGCSKISKTMWKHVSAKWSWIKGTLGSATLLRCCKNNVFLQSGLALKTWCCEIACLFLKTMWKFVIKKRWLYNVAVRNFYKCFRKVSIELTKTCSWDVVCVTMSTMFFHVFYILPKHVSCCLVDCCHCGKMLQGGFSAVAVFFFCWNVDCFHDV